MLSFRTGESGFAYLGLRGVPDRNAAELLRGKEVEAERDDAPPLDEGTYYIVDLIGCEVSDESGKVYGTLTDVTSLASDVYTVSDGKEELALSRRARRGEKRGRTGRKKLCLTAKF